MQDLIPLNSPAPWPPVAAARRLRLWPGVVIVLLYWAALKLPGWIVPGTMAQFMISGFGSMALAAVFVLWWLFFSRVTWGERFAGLLVFGAVGGAAWYWFDPSLQGRHPFDTIMSLTFSVLPVVLTGWVAWLLLARSFQRPVRLAGLVVVMLLTWGYFTALRMEGVTGVYSPEFSYRWQPTAEDQFKADRAANQSTAETVAATGPPLTMTPADWPGFRGMARDGRRAGIRIPTDWTLHPPKQVWRHRIGPGWSSFAVVGPRLFTQEQLGDDEGVVCYDADTGKEVWAHTDEAALLGRPIGRRPTGDADLPRRPDLRSRRHRSAQLPRCCHR